MGPHRRTHHQPRRTLGALLALLAALAPGRGAAGDAGPARALPGTWRVAADPDWPPYSYRGPDGKLMGLDVEFSRTMAERAGVQLEWVDVPSWSEALRRFRAREVDLLMGTAQTPERAREMIFTQPYAASPVAVIARLDAPFLVTLGDLAGQVVAVPEGHATTDFLRKAFPGLQLLPCATLEEAIRAVADRRADSAVAGLVPAATLARDLGLADLKVAGLMDARFDLRVAVRPDWPQVRALLDRVIAADPPELRVARFDRWLQPVLGLQGQAQRWRLLSRWGIAVAAALAASVVAIGLWNRTLRARVTRATAAIRAEMAARAESELRFRTMFEQAPVGMFRSTADGKFLSVNPCLATLFDYPSPEAMVEEVNRRGIPETLFEDPSQRSQIVGEVLGAAGRQRVAQVRYRTRAGRPLDGLLSMTAVDDPVDGTRSLLGFVQDVTDRVREQATRQQREKLSALGQMAGGVAHDLNNLMTLLTAEADALRAGGPATAEAGERVQGAVDGARALTGRLLRFVRARSAEPAGRYDAHQVIREALELFRSASGRRVKVVAALDARAPQLAGARADLQGALLNLCLNARDAMPGGGTLTVRTCELPPGPGAPSRLAVELTDTGQGMAPEVLARCREPFFTTKGEAGTGLGLWTAGSVVESQGGTLEVESAPGRGTTVRIVLPLAVGPG